MVKLIWDTSTKYDFFISLSVLLNPDRFNLRATWAAGVRSRIPAEERSILEIMHANFHIPAAWCYQLKSPKSAGETVIGALHTYSDESVIPEIFLHSTQEENLRSLLLSVANRGGWQDDDMREIKAAFQKNLFYNRPNEIKALLNGFSDLPKMGARYKRALTLYFETFFKEEEQRILPYLQQNLEFGEALLRHQPPLEVIATLCDGLTLQLEAETQTLIASPSYWITPMVSFDHIARDIAQLIYGCRPQNETLVPGESISPQLLHALKALADPTRLKIMKLLVRSPLSPKRIAEELRLRAPTVIHHLQLLRSSGLVHLILNDQQERLYSVEPHAIQITLQLVHDLLDPTIPDPIEEQP